MSNRERPSPGADDYMLVPAKSIETSRLAAFAAAVWPTRSPEDHFLTGWWRRADPDCAIAAVHRATGEMAGICGGRSCEWMIAGRRLPAVAICDWYVAPAHAGKGLGKRLVRHFEMPERFLYAFSISDAAIANFERLGWIGPYRSALMALPVPRVIGFPAAWRAARSGLDLERRVVAGGEPLGSLGSELDRIETQRMGDASAAHMTRGASDWSWRLSICGERNYHFCIARRSGLPVGYVVARTMAGDGHGPLGRLRTAIVTDLVAVDDDATVLRALAGSAAAISGELRAAVAVTATTTDTHRRALVRAGFLSPTFPVLGRLLGRRAPQFMWLPRGPGAALAADQIALTFADAAIDLDL